MRSRGPLLAPSLPARGIIVAAPVVTGQAPVVTGRALVVTDQVLVPVLVVTGQVLVQVLEATGQVLVPVPAAPLPLCPHHCARPSTTQAVPEMRFRPLHSSQVAPQRWRRRPRL